MTESKAGLIDSNILIYACDKSQKEKYEKAKAFLAERLMAKDSFVSIQNLVEFHANATEKIEKPIDFEKSKLAMSTLAASLIVLKYDECTIQEAINYQQLYKIPFWDGLIAATMKENSLDLVYTEDIFDFKKIPWLKVVNPLELE